MRVHSRLLVLLVFLIRSGAAADRVRTEEGRIVVEDSSGRKTVLTDTGRDSDPWISPDGRTIVFVRQSPEDMSRNSVYEFDMRTRTAKLLYAGPAKYQGRESSYFGQPELNESNDKLFVISKEYATEGALISIRLASGEAMVISDHVVGFDVIQCPKKHRGDLIVLKRHEEDILGRPYFLYYMYSAAGLDLGLAGDGELDAELDFVRHGSCEGLERQPSSQVPSGPTSPSVGDAIRVDASAMVSQLVTHVEPIYPGQAQSEHIQGDVRLQVRIAEDGTVQDVNLVSGPPQLVGAAIAAVKQWKYQPVISSGHPVAVVTIVSVPFRLP
jgi:TonB family protein